MATSVFSTLVSYDQIRAQLGASSTVDITDEQLDALVLDDELYSSLYSWFPQYKTLIDDTSDDSAIVAQKTNLVLWAKWYSCYIILESGPLRFLKARNDSENKAERFSSNLIKMKDSMLAKADISKERLLKIITTYSPVASDNEITLFAVVTPNKNVITSGRVG